METEPTTDQHLADMFAQCIRLRHELNHARRRMEEAWAALIVIAAVSIVVLVAVTK